MSTKIFEWRQWGSWFCFMSSIILMYFLFLNPPVQLKETYQPKPEARTQTIPCPQSIKPTPQAQLMMQELKKAISEINLRLQHESDWYEMKFLFMGIIFLGFIALVYNNKGRGEGEKESLNLSTMTKYPGVILALALTVIVSIDTHLRANQKVISQNGIWIAHFAEPFFLGVDTKKPIEDRPFYGWENFLRAKSTTEGGQAYYTDITYAVTFWPHIFLITIFAYIAFMLVLFVNESIAKVPLVPRSAFCRR